LSLGDISEKERAENVWGWGPQDNLLYKDIFKKMDKLNKAQEEKKFFVSMLGVSSHMMFDKVPKNQRMLFPENRTKKEKYANAIRVVDKYLEVFFKELEKRDYLKNSIVIITGDHSFPVGEHGLYHSERGFYNEFFKVPLLILWKDKLRPQRIKKRSYSQVDISPTILDLIGVKTSNHFQGVSIFKKKKVLQYLVQPYSGKYLSIVDYPLKYVFHEKSRTEYLFDLEKDQGESENLISLILSGEIKKKVDFFREKLGYFYVNDILIEENRVWKD
jgi:phosphoglycerol transferase MdoB-like AlkP superfamily enzyme